MAMSKHVLEPEELMAYLDGERSPERAAAHLGECRECQEVAADLQGVSRRMLDWEVEAPAAQMSADLRAALRERRPKGGHWAFGNWKWVLGAAAVCLLAVAMFLPKLAIQRHAPVDMVRTSALMTPQLAMQTRAVQDAAAPASKPMIARTAQVTLTTRDFDKTRAALDDILKRHNGYIGELNVSTPAGAGRSIEATLRVPAGQLEPALAEVRRLGRVESESQNGEEVTAQFVDLEARLANSRNTEQRLTELLRQRTGKLADVLEVEVEISRVRGEIERMEAERKSLLKRVDFATLNVSVRENYRAQLQESSSLAGRLRCAGSSTTRGPPARPRARASRTGGDRRATAGPTPRRGRRRTAGRRPAPSRSESASRDGRSWTRTRDLRLIRAAL